MIFRRIVVKSTPSTKVVPTKINTFYIHVTSEDETVVYTVTIVRLDATQAPVTTTAKSAKRGGCKLSLTASTLAILPTLVGGALLIKKRKDD